MLVTGLYALACWPASMFADRLHWRQDLITSTAVLACIVCAITGVLHLLADRGRPEQPVLSVVPTRKVAAAAVVLAGGFVLLLALLIVALFVSSPMD